MKKWLLLIIIGGMLVMCTACSSSEQLRRATWLWDATLLKDEQRIISFLTTHQFNTVFVQIDDAVAKDVYATFIRAANEKQIDVYALGGAPTWGSNQSEADAFFNWLTHYNASYDISFTGIHVDVEPYLHPQWHEKQPLIIEQFQQFLTAAKQQATALGLPLEADLPFWFDTVLYDNAFGQGNLAQWVINTIDGVTLMAYRNNAEQIISITEPEIAFAADANKKVTIGIETMQSEEGDFVSFYGQSYTEINNALQHIITHYEHSAFEGVALHHYETINTLIN